MATSNENIDNTQQGTGKGKGAAAAAIEKAKAMSAAKSGEQPTLPETTNGTASTAPTTTATKKPSPKSKEARGIDASLVTTWVDVNNTEEFNETLKKVAKVRKCSVVAIYQGILAEVMTPERISALQAEAATAPETKSSGTSIDKMTPEQLEKQASKAELELEKIKAKLAAVKAAKANAANGGASTTEAPAE